MNAKQFRKELARAGISQRAFAKLLGVSERTARAWALGERERDVPEPVAILVRLMASGKVSVDDVDAASRP